MPSNRREDEKIDLKRGVKSYGIKSEALYEHEIERRERIQASHPNPNPNPNPNLHCDNRLTSASRGRVAIKKRMGSEHRTTPLATTGIFGASPEQIPGTFLTAATPSSTARNASHQTALAASPSGLECLTLALRQSCWVGLWCSRAYPTEEERMHSLQSARRDGRVMFSQG